MALANWGLVEGCGVARFCEGHARGGGSWCERDVLHRLER